METLDYQLNEVKQLVDRQYNEASHVFDGLMLGDGNLTFNGKNAYFAITLSDNKKYIQRETIPVDRLFEFLQHITMVLASLGIKPNFNSPKINLHDDKLKNGKYTSSVELCTNISDFLTYQYSRWYQNADKYYNTKAHSYRYINAERVVPKDFTLTPVSLAYWFMGDGCSIWKDATGIDVSLCTYNYMLGDIEYLEDQLHRLGLNTGRSFGGNQPLCKNKLISYISITIPQSDVDNFMRIVEPYIVDPYLYKVKYRGSCPAEFANKLKKRHNEYMQEYKMRHSECNTSLYELKKLIAKGR